MFHRISEELFKEELIKEEDKIKIMKALLLRHRHVNEHHDRGFKFSNKKQSYASLQVSHPQNTIVKYAFVINSGKDDNELSWNILFLRNRIFTIYKIFCKFVIRKFKKKTIFTYSFGELDTKSMLIMQQCNTN